MFENRTSENCICPKTGHLRVQFLDIFDSLDHFWIKNIFYLKQSRLALKYPIKPRCFKTGCFWGVQKPDCFRTLSVPLNEIYSSSPT